MGFESSTTMAASTITLEKASLIAGDDGARPKTTNPCNKKKHMSKKCELVDYKSLPSFMKHNDFILGYYRSEWPLKETILSIFSIHNETLNIWTHLIGFFIFLALTAATVSMASTNLSSNQYEMQHELVNYPSSVQSWNFSGGIAASAEGLLFHANETGTASVFMSTAAENWPLYAYLGGAMFCLLMSSACHLLCCHSEHTCYVMLRLDYAGITGLIVTSFFPTVYYTFMCDPFLRTLYLSIITVFGVAAVAASLMPVFDTPQYRLVRSGLYVCMGLSGLVPIINKMIIYGDRPEAVVTTAYEMAMGLFYGLGVVAYATRVPERWMPGKFDLAGHSHQLFHVFVVAGAYTHYLAGLEYLNWRTQDGC